LSSNHEEDIKLRRIIAAEFMSIDGVVESPDKWHSPYFNDELGEAQSLIQAETDTILLGRRTYEEFAQVWPKRTTAEVGPIADFINNTPKLVASTTLRTVEWHNSSLIKGNVAQELRNLKQQPGATIFIIGSPTLVRSLLYDGVLDELRLLVDPIIVGQGKRLFEGVEVQLPLKLVDSKTFKTGVLSLTYAAAER
jgi:dihydrofolate reductase